MSKYDKKNNNIKIYFKNGTQKFIKNVESYRLSETGFCEFFYKEGRISILDFVNTVSHYETTYGPGCPYKCGLDW
jgi:hypothetical protein